MVAGELAVVQAAGAGVLVAAAVLLEAVAKVEDVQGHCRS
jgi:hypothetical protein